MKGASIRFATKLLINKFMLVLNSVSHKKLVFYFQKKTAIFHLDYEQDSIQIHCEVGDWINGSNNNSTLLRSGYALLKGSSLQN